MPQPKGGIAQGDYTITELKDQAHPYPGLKEMRASQKAGSEGRGLPANSEDALNECQGHNVKIEGDE